MMNPATLAAVGIYASLSMIVMYWITVKTGQLRTRYKISIGDGGNAHMQRILRGHANAVENIPMFFIMMVIAALLGMPVIAAHVLGAVFTIARAIHASYFIAETASPTRRIIGFSLSALSHVILLAGLLAHGVWTLLG